jgi:heavy-metal resistance protein
MKRFVIPMMLLLGAAPAFAQTTAPAATSPAQQQIEATRTRFQSQMKPLWQDAKATRQALSAELQKSAPDNATLQQLTDKLTSDRQQLHSLRSQQLAELKDQLSPQQYAKLMLRHPGFGRHMHGGHGRQQGSGSEQ